MEYKQKKTWRFFTGLTTICFGWEGWIWLTIIMYVREQYISPRKKSINSTG
jgi:hypothetical protein